MKNGGFGPRFFYNNFYNKTMLSFAKNSAYLILPVNFHKP